MDFKDYIHGVSESHFWFQAKKKLITFLFSHIKPNHNARILNLGAGTGDDLSVIKQFGKISVIDINQQALDLIPSSMVIDKRCCSATNLPYNNNTFDVTVAFDLLEHINDDQKVITEVLRVLKPGGHFILTVPAYQWLFSQHDVYLHHRRRYNKKTIQTLCNRFSLSKSGFFMFSLFPIAATIRIFSRLTGKCFWIEKKPNKIINFLSSQFLNSDIWLIKKGLTLPFGLTIYGIYQKPNIG